MITGLMTGGAETTLVRLLPNISELGDQHSVISLTDKGTQGARLRTEGATVFELRMRPPYPSLSGLARLRSLVRRLRPDLIQGWMYHGNLAASVGRVSPTSRFSGTPVIWNVRHSLYDLSKEKRTTRAVIRVSALVSRSVDRIVYNSEVGAKQHEAIGFANDGSVVIRNGFDGELFKPDGEAAKALRTKLGIGQDVVLVGMVARYHPMKDHRSLLRAAALVRRANPNVHFALVGRSSDNHNWELAGLVQDLSLGGCVHLLGEISRPETLLAGLDVLCSPSCRGEGLSNVVGEAMACAVPCVVTDIGDTPWLVGDTGVVVPPGNYHVLAKALGRLVEMGENERGRLGRAARDRVLGELPALSAARRYRQLYSEVLER